MNHADDLQSRFLASLRNLHPASTRGLSHGKVLYATYVPGKTYIVQSGYVRLMAIGENGDQFTRMLLGRGSIFGDLPFTPPLSMKEESAITSGATSILECQRHTIEAVVHRDEVLCKILLEVYSRQLGLMDRRVQWQFAAPLRRRVAMILLDLMEFGRAPCPHHDGFLVDIRMTHEELSELVGAARPNVTAILNEFRDEGLLRYTRTYLCVRSLSALGQIVQSHDMR